MRKKLSIVATVCITMSALVLTGCEKEDKDAISMSQATKGAVTVPGKDGKEYMAVDLGLPDHRLWGTCNIGANTPDESGTFFSWGETAPKGNYSYDNYKWCDGDFSSMTKYTCDFDHTKSKQLDSISVLQAEDDPAAQILGEGWSTPTRSQFTAMINRCDWKVCKLEGTWGYLFTSKENGNTIFIPLAGCKDYEDLLHTSDWGFYWTKDLHTAESHEVYVLQLKKPANPVATKFQERYIGLPVRATYKAPRN
jgi:hypothetical protein